MAASSNQIVSNTSEKTDCQRPNQSENETTHSASNVGPTESTEGDPGSEEKEKRAEIDTSAPFASVMEAVTLFGGIGFWRSHSHKFPSQASEHDIDVFDIAKVEAQAALLEKDLIVKERETLDVLKELETAKMIMEELRVKINKEASNMNTTLINSYSHDKNVSLAMPVAEKELSCLHHRSAGNLDLRPSSTPGFISMELKQAMLNLTRTTYDLADIRATVEAFNMKIEKEMNSLEKTRQRLSSSSSKMLSLEKEQHQTKQKLQLVSDAEIKGCSDNAMDMSRELQRLSFETEQYKQIGKAARSEVTRVMSEVEQTKSRIKTARISLVAAKRMKEAARFTEAVALAKMKALLSKSESSSGIFQLKPKEASLSFEEYSSLTTTKAGEAEKVREMKEKDVILLVDEANLSKKEILKRVEEATKEVKTSKKVLVEALRRGEASNTEKLAVEETMRKWRSKHGQKRRCVRNSSKCKKNSNPIHHRKEFQLHDVSGLNLINDDDSKPTQSIGQILRRKLLLMEEFENGEEQYKGGRGNVSLGEMLSKANGVVQPAAAKRKKFGFGRISVLLVSQKESKKKLFFPY